MKLLNKILYATDFSSSSEGALKTARYVAATFESKVFLMNVMPDLNISDLHEEMIKSASEKELQKIATSLSEDRIEIGGITVKKGVPFIEIIEEANLHNVNVIILGSGTNAEDASFKLGMTAEKVMQKSKKPVWVIRPDDRGRIEKIVCAVDFSSPSERALSNAIHLARRFNAHLDVITVIPELTGFYNRILGNYQNKIENFRSQHKRNFAEFIKKFDLNKVDWDNRILEGIPEVEITRFTRGQNPDILLMGTVGQDDSFRMQMGSVSKKVARSMPASIITFRSEHLIQLHFDQQLTDLVSHFELGKKLMENGFPEEALNQFRICIERDLLYAPAYEASAEALERTGNPEEADAMRSNAREIRSRLWQKNVESEIRGKHVLFKKK